MRDESNFFDRNWGNTEYMPTAEYKEIEYEEYEEVRKIAYEEN